MERVADMFSPEQPQNQEARQQNQPHGDQGDPYSGGPHQTKPTPHGRPREGTLI